MSYELDIRPAALADIEENAGWYEQQQLGLGADFARTVRLAINTLSRDALIHRVRDRRRNVRWVIAPRFPYKIVYRVRDQIVTVIGVIHAARHDRHWKQRL